MVRKEKPQFEGVFNKIIKVKEEKQLQKQRRELDEERERLLRERLIKRSPMTKSRGKKLKVSAKQGARGLFDLL